MAGGLGGAGGVIVGIGVGATEMEELGLIAGIGATAETPYALGMLGATIGTAGAAILLPPAYGVYLSIPQCPCD